jgi:hypothetical protein
MDLKLGGIVTSNSATKLGLLVDVSTNAGLLRQPDL